MTAGARVFDVDAERDTLAGVAKRIRRDPRLTADAVDDLVRRIEAVACSAIEERQLRRDTVDPAVTGVTNRT